MKAYHVTYICDETSKHDKTIQDCVITLEDVVRDADTSAELTASRYREWISEMKRTIRRQEYNNVPHIIVITNWKVLT